MEEESRVEMELRFRASGPRQPRVFSLELPRMLYYPFQASSLREYIYRLNFPLEDTVGRMFFSNIN